MNIQVRVVSAAAIAQLRAVEAASRGAAAGATGMGSAASRGIPALSKWGNQIQWAGRQLTYNFTLPIALAMGAATKFALDNERMMVRVQKVYGDGSRVFNRLSKTEIPALAQAFEALSNQFGIQRKEVIQIAGDWAAAGASGIALAKSVKLTLETMILGELGAADATKQLIAIQAQYGMNTNQLSKTIDILNMVENQTGASMKDLMDGMSRAAGVARVTGVDVEHLSAMMAALVPSTGSAATAGNALKTIMSRLIAPTKDAADILGQIGIHLNTTSWQSMNASDRIELLAKKYKGLSSAQKANAASVLGSRWQFNRLVVLLNDVNNKNGYYRKSLAATSDTQKVFNQRQKELNQVLTSNPQMIKQAGVILQNSLANVIVPLIPYIVYMAQKLAELSTWFSHLSGTTQKWILAGLVFLALIGPIARYVGAVANLIGIMSEAVKFAGRAFMFMAGGALRALVALIALPFRAVGGLAMIMGRALLSVAGWIITGFAGIDLAIAGPIILGVAAALGIAYAFRNQIANIWKNISQIIANSGMFSPVVSFFQNMVNRIIGAFYSLPIGIQNALLAVVNVVKSAAMQVYQWMSYLNPFARHSPSLVDSVKKGMDTIKGHFKKSGDAGTHFKKSADHLARFKKEANNLKTAVNNQQNVVDKWANALDRANNKLDAEQAKLQKIRDRLDQVQAAYDKHKTAMEAFANAPIKGMQKFDDSLFANEIAQKKLQLRMLKWQDAHGDIDKIKSKIDSLSGDIENLSGRATSLRLSGAGSDVLGPIEAQVRAMERQRAHLTSSVNNSPMTQMQNQLDQLQRQSQILQLTRDIKFDPLTRQIDQLANAQKELNFNDIVKGIRREKAAMASLQPTIDKLTKAADAQDKVVKKAQATRDAVQKRHDAEAKALDRLQKAYSKVKAKVDDLTSAHKKAAAAAKAKAGKAPSFAIQSFQDAAKGNFPDVGGQAKIGREKLKGQPRFGDQSAAIKQFALDSANQTAKMFGKFDMFGPLKTKWRDAWAWVKENVGPNVAGVRDAIGGAFTGMGNPFGGKGSGLVKSFQGTFDTITAIARTVGGTIKSVVQLFAPNIKQNIGTITDAFKKLWTDVAPQLADFSGVFKSLGPAIAEVWNLAKPLVLLLGGALLFALKIMANIISHTLDPVLDILIDTIKNVIKFIRGIAEIIVGLLSGNIDLALKGVADIFTSFFAEIGDIFWQGYRIILNVVEGIVTGIYDFFKWLYDQLVGHSIIPDLIAAIFRVFKGLLSLPKWIFDHTLKPIFEKFKSLWKDHIKPELASWPKKIHDVWSVLGRIPKWVWDHSLGAVFGMFKGLWKDHVKPDLQAWPKRIHDAWSVLSKLGKWLYDHSLGYVFNAFKNLWKDHIKPELGKWWDRIKTVLNPLKDLAKWAKTHVLDPLLNMFKNFFGRNGHIRNALDTGVGAIGKIWDKLKGLAGSPVRFLVETVYSKGIVPMVNAIPGLPKKWHLGAKSVPWATGGVLPGFTPGRDVHHFVSPTGGRLSLSGGEAIMRPEWTKAVGGPAEVARQNKLARRGALRAAANSVGVVGDRQFYNGGVLRFSQGGTLGGGKVDKSVKGAQMWARSQVGHPYQMGAVGPRAYDCSGFMAAITNYLRGQSIHHRLGSTANFPWPGFKRGVGEFTIGSTPNYGGSGIGHMAGTLGGLNVESRGGQGVVVGKNARGYRDHGFREIYHLGKAGDFGYGGAGGGGGGSYALPGKKPIKNPLGFLHLNKWISRLKHMGAWGEMIGGTVKGAIPNAMGWVKDKIKALWGRVKSWGGGLLHNILGDGGTWHGGPNSGGGTAQYVPIVRQVLHDMGENFGSPMIATVMRRMRQEDSSGNLGAVNRTDSNARAGHPSVGLMQVIRGTYGTYHKRPQYHPSGPFVEGVNINPYDNIWAGLNYGRHTYGSIAAAMNKKGGYKNGGVIPGFARGAIIRHTSGGTLAQVGEGRHDEAIVPLPHSWRSDVSQPKDAAGNVINIHGNLSFPNIKSGDDAELFVKNLARLAKD